MLPPFGPPPRLHIRPRRRDRRRGDDGPGPLDGDGPRDPQGGGNLLRRDHPHLLGGVLSYVYHGLGVSGLPFSLGYINLLQVALLAGASIPTARVGVRAAHRIPSRPAEEVFTLLMVYIGLEMMGASRC